MKNIYGLIIVSFFVTATVFSCRTGDEIRPQLNFVPEVLTLDQTTSNNQFASNSVPTRKHDGSWAVRWMQLAYKLVTRARISPPVASRFYGYAGLTIYESVVNGMPNNTSLAGVLNQMPSMPIPDNTLTYDWPTVMNRAVSLVVKNVIASPNTSINNSIDSLYAMQVSERQNYANQSTIQNSINYGTALSNALITYAASDNFQATRSLTYTPPPRSINPAYWEPTSPGQVPVEPYWAMIRPFALTDLSFTAQPPPYSTIPSTPFYNEALEVKNKFYSLTNEEKAIAIFWADNAGQTGTPPGHWIAIAGQLILDNQINLRRASILYLKLGIGVADAFISCWDTKYKVNLLRPKTYIRESLSDPTWESFIPTPPFPEYPSGHSVVSGAAAIILTRFFGEVPFTDHTHITRGLASRSFTSFNQAALEAALSRLYGGIHYRSAIDKGLKHGKDVAIVVLDKIKIKDAD